jgi:hypothetical protein
MSRMPNTEGKGINSPVCNYWVDKGPEPGCWNWPEHSRYLDSPEENGKFTDPNTTVFLNPSDWWIYETKLLNPYQQHLLRIPFSAFMSKITELLNYFMVTFTFASLPSGRKSFKVAMMQPWVTWRNVRHFKFKKGLHNNVLRSKCKPKKLKKRLQTIARTYGERKSMILYLLIFLDWRARLKTCHLATCRTVPK